MATEKVVPAPVSRRMNPACDYPGIVVFGRVTAVPHTHRSSEQYRRRKPHLERL